MTFLSGFAEGFIAERDKVRNRKNELDDQSFQYRMKFLTDQREKRDSKKLKETELAKKAQYLAQKMGDPNFAKTAYNEMVLGNISETELEDRILKGYYKKNDKYVTPTTTMKVPVGVTMDAAESDPYNAFPKNEAVDARIDAIDPTLRQPITAENNNSMFSDSDANNNEYVYKPSNEFDAGSLPDVQLEILKAEEANDPKRLREAQQKMKAHQIVMTMQENAKARATGANINTYVILDENGRAVSTFAGEQDGENLWNKTTNQIVPISQRAKLVMTNENALKEWAALDKNFGTKSADLRQATASYTASLETTQKIVNLLGKNQNVATMTGSVARVAADLEGEAKAAYELFQQQKSDLQAKVDNGVVPTEQEVAGLNKTIEDLLQKTETPDGLLGKQVHSLGRDAAQYDALMTALVYQMASSNGLTMAKASDFDVKQFKKMVGADRVNPSDIFAAMKNMHQSVVTKLDSERTMFNKQPSITNFKTRWGFDPNVEVPRVEQLLKEQGKEGLIETFRQMNGDAQWERLNAVKQAQEQEAIVDGNGEQIPSDDIDILEANPSEEYRKFFNETYGPGAASRVLGD